VSKFETYLPPASAAKPLSPTELLASLRSALAPWQPGTPFWIFAYGSLMWNPSFSYDARHVATIRGYHRSFRVWSRINRGTPEKPGLVLTLECGGSCRGLIYRIPADLVQEQMNLIWKREMNYGSYRPKWLSCTVGDETLRALRSRHPGSRLYASGCLVRLDADGKLQYLGNLQEQVKIGSHQISLKEIEAVVTQHSAVRHTVIRVDEEEGQKSLVAYVVPDETAATPPALSDLGYVTDYLRPAAYVVLDQLPLSAEGEVELAALPKAEVVKTITEYVAPRDPLEIVLAKIWMDILEVEKISVHDNFFRLGGHSLLGTMANVNVSDAFGIEVPINVLFEAPTIAEFANKLRQDPNEGQRFEEIAALLVSVEEMSDEAVKALIEKEQAA